MSAPWQWAEWAASQGCLIETTATGLLAWLCGYAVGAYRGR